MGLLGARTSRTTAKRAPKAASAATIRIGHVGSHSAAYTWYWLSWNRPAPCSVPWTWKNTVRSANQPAAASHAIARRTGATRAVSPVDRSVSTVERVVSPAEGACPPPSAPSGAAASREAHRPPMTTIPPAIRRGTIVQAGVPSR